MSLLGNVAGASIGDLFNRYKAHKEAKKPENRLRAVLQTQIDQDLANYEAEITAKNPGISPVDAKVQAAQRALGETAKAKDHPVRKMIRDTAERSLAQMHQFDPEGLQKLADAKTKLASAANGDITNLVNLKTGARMSVPKGTALSLITAGSPAFNPDWVEGTAYSPPGPPKPGDKTEIMTANGDRRQLVYDKNEELFPGEPHNPAGYYDETDLITARKAKEDAAAAAKVAHTQDLQEKRYINNTKQMFDRLPEVVNYKAVLPVANSAADAADTASGDFIIVNSLAKIADPSTGVREADYRNALASTSPKEQIVGALRFYVDGKGRLTKKSREEMVAEMNNRVNNYRKAYDQAREVATKNSIDTEIDPYRIIGEHPGDAYPSVKTTTETAAEMAKRVLRTH
jgi:hypothetical protein